jgi:hypothetical protein
MVFVLQLTSIVICELSKKTSGLGPKKVLMINLNDETEAVELMSKSKHGLTKHEALCTTAKGLGAESKVTPCRVTLVGWQ